MLHEAVARSCFFGVRMMSKQRVPRCTAGKISDTAIQQMDKGGGWMTDVRSRVLVWTE